MIRIVLDAENGNILSMLNDGDRIVKAQSIDKYKEFETIPESETFTKLYHKVLPLLSDSNLTSTAFAIFLYLSCNLSYQSNVAKYRNGKLIDRESLQKDLKLPDRTLKRSIYTLIREGLIVEAKTIEGKVFIVNPYVVMVGEKISKTVYDLFRKSKWARW